MKRVHFDDEIVIQMYDPSEPPSEVHSIATATTESLPRNRQESQVQLSISSFESNGPFHRLRRMFQWSEWHHCRIFCCVVLIFSAIIIGAFYCYIRYVKPASSSPTMLH